MYASLALVVLTATYLVATEPGGLAPANAGPVTALAEKSPQLGTDAEKDRNVVLVNLAITGIETGDEKLRSACWWNPRVLVTLLLVFLAGGVCGALVMRYGVHAGRHQTAVTSWKEGDAEISVVRFKAELGLTRSRRGRWRNPR